MEFCPLDHVLDWQTTLRARRIIANEIVGLEISVPTRFHSCAHGKKIEFERDVCKWNFLWVTTCIANFNKTRGPTFVLKLLFSFLQTPLSCQWAEKVKEIIKIKLSMSSMCTMLLVKQPVGPCFPCVNSGSGMQTSVVRKTFLVTFIILVCVE